MLNIILIISLSVSIICNVGAIIIRTYDMNKDMNNEEK